MQLQLKNGVYVRKIEKKRTRTQSETELTICENENIPLSSDTDGITEWSSTGSRMLWPERNIFLLDLSGWSPRDRKVFEIQSFLVFSQTKALKKDSAFYNPLTAVNHVPQEKTSRYSFRSVNRALGASYSCFVMMWSPFTVKVHTFERTDLKIFCMVVGQPRNALLKAFWSNEETRIIVVDSKTNVLQK